MHDNPTALFVYGTLKQGQVRGQRWPRQPLSVENAFVWGELYDLGPYPALLPPRAGTRGDRIAGEVWTFAATDMPAVLQTLDEIEGYNQPQQANLYERVVIGYESETGERGKAFTYHYATRGERLSSHSRLPPGPAGCCQWPGSEG